MLSKFETSPQIEIVTGPDQGTVVLPGRGKFLYNKTMISKLQRDLPYELVLISLKPYDEVVALINKQQLLLFVVAVIAVVLVILMS